MYIYSEVYILSVRGIPDPNNFVINYLGFETH